MELVLKGWPGRISAAAVAVAATAALSLTLWKHLEATWLAQEGSLASLERAQQLEPRNAELYWRAGLLELYSESSSPSDAATAFDQATKLDPRAGIYWADLALARENAGDMEGAGRDLARARAAEPRTPVILWRSMNFALRNNQQQQALQIARDLLAEAPPYTGRVLPQLLEITDLRTLIGSVLPTDQSAIDAVTDYVYKSGDVTGAEALWAKVIATGLAPSRFYLRLLIDSLISVGAGPLAEQVWTDSIRRGWIPGDTDDLAQPLYNGDLRRPMLGFGFDWKVIPQAEASVWVSDDGPQPGEPCLCADFSDRARADFGNVTHPVVVEPGERYLLTAKLRVRHVSTHAGTYLSISAYGPTGGQMATTDHIVGSTGWEEVSAQFEAGPAGHVAQIALQRPGVGPDEPPASGQVCMAAVGWRHLRVTEDKAGVPAAGRATR